MKTKSWIEAHVSHLLAALLIIQPIMDVVSFWFLRWELPSFPTLVLRLGVFALTFLTAFLISNWKWVYYIAAGICLFLAAGHIYACMQIPGGYQSPVTDLTNFVRVVQMPVTVICIITFLRKNDRAFQGLQLGFSLSLLIMLAVEVLCVVTRTDYGTYKDGMGTIGWFSNTNSQSNNLCMLIPISLAWQITWEKRRPWLFWLTAVAGLTALFFFGTRLAYLGIYAVCVGFIIVIALIRRSDWKSALVLLAFALAATVLIPYSPMYAHMNVDNAVQDRRQGDINTKLGDNLDEVKTIIQKSNNAKADSANKNEPGKEDEKENTGMTEAERRRLIRDLTPIYEFYVKDFVDIFGAEKTIEMFNYSIDVRDFSALRAKKLMFAQMLMNDSPVSSQIFGLNLARFTVGENIYDVENDFHGIYYLYGWAGLAAYLLFLAYFVWLIIWALIKNARQYFTVEAASYGIAFLLCMAHAYNTAGVLRRPNASIYLSAVLAGIYYLVRIRKYEPLPPKSKKEKKTKTAR